MNWTYKSLTFRYGTGSSNVDIDIAYQLTLNQIMIDSGTPESSTLVKQGGNFICTIIYKQVKIS